MSQLEKLYDEKNKALGKPPDPLEMGIAPLRTKYLRPLTPAEIKKTRRNVMRKFKKYVLF